MLIKHTLIFFLRKGKNMSHQPQKSIPAFILIIIITTIPIPPQHILKGEKKSKLFTRFRFRSHQEEERTTETDRRTTVLTYFLLVTWIYYLFEYITYIIILNVVSLPHHTRSSISRKLFTHALHYRTYCVPFPCALHKGTQQDKMLYLIITTSIKPRIWHKYLLALFFYQSPTR